MNTVTQFELVLPCYNESQSLPALIRRAVDAAKEAGFTPAEFKLILVENGSKDNSKEVMEKLSEDIELGRWFRPVFIPLNQGYGFGLWQGLQSTQAPIVGWSHADQQCDPKDAFKALALLKDQGEKSTLVKGIRFGRNWKDRVVSAVFATFAKLVLGIGMDEINAQPKVFSRTLLDRASAPPKDFSFDLYMLYQARKMGLKFRTIPVLFPPRIHGVSNWAATFWGRHRTILNMIKYMWALKKSEGRL